MLRFREGPDCRDRLDGYKRAPDAKPVSACPGSAHFSRRHLFGNMHDPMDQPQTRTSPLPHHHVDFEPLRWIGAYKLLKGLLALIGALLVMRLMHRNLPEVATHWLTRLSIDPQSEFGQFVLKKVIALHARNLMWAAMLLQGYVIIAVVEGVGLILRRAWAEWLTVVTTAGMIPFEMYEFARRFTWVRLTILLLNILVVIYLIWRIRRDQQRHQWRRPVLSQQPTASDQKSGR
jgi:uncharacterized membrane protein (DUF2068 family)